MTAPVAATEPKPMLEIQKLVFLITACGIMLLSLVDISIVSTAAMPIVRDLDPHGGFAQVPWLISAFSITATVVLPLYGKLSDRYGPRRMYLVALAIFFAGTAACGLARSMPQLMVFRAVQGVGGGGLTSVALIIIAMLWPPKQRASRSGVGGGLFAIAAVFGPMVGGPISEYLSWRWVFGLQLPLVGLAALVALTAVRLPDRRTYRRIDLVGVAVFVVAVAALLLCADRITADGWRAPVVWISGVAGVLCAAAFCFHQVKAREPFLPVVIVRTRSTRTLLLLQFVCGFALMSLPLFLVSYLNVERGLAPSAVGFQLAPMGVGIFAVLLVWGRWLKRLGNFKPLLLVNTSIGLLGLVAFTLLPDHANYLLVAGCLVLMGIGMGGVTQMALLATQISAPAEHLGQATTGARFSSTLGTAFGAAILGTVLSLRLSHAARVAVLQQSATTVSADRWHQLTAEYLRGSNLMFWVAAAVLVVAVVQVFRMPDIRIDTPDTADDSEPGNAELAAAEPADAKTADAMPADAVPADAVLADAEPADAEPGGGDAVDAVGARTNR